MGRIQNTAMWRSLDNLKCLGAGKDRAQVLAILGEIERLGHLNGGDIVHLKQLMIKIHAIGYDRGRGGELSHAPDAKEDEKGKDK